MSELKEVNQILQTKNNELKMKLIEQEEKLKEYDELLNKLKLKKEKQKIYYRIVTKPRQFYCDLCDKSLKIGSLSNHYKSDKHLENKNKRVHIEI